MASPLGRKSRIRKLKKQELDGPRSEINVTPLVDVCLVLLIIFMVVTPMLARGKDVPLPKTTQHEEDNDKNQPIVAIDGDGFVYFDKDRIGQVDRPDDLEKLKQRVEEAWRADDAGEIQGKVFIKADKNLVYKKVYPLLMAIHELGVQGVELGTNELKDEKSE